MTTLYQKLIDTATANVNYYLEAFQRALDELDRYRILAEILDVEAPEPLTCYPTFWPDFYFPYDHKQTDLVLLQLLAKGCQGDLPTPVLQGEENLGIMATFKTPMGIQVRVISRPNGQSENCQLVEIGRHTVTKEIPIYEVKCSPEPEN